jgi:uncharacterized protein YutE (UPF0331/DUF86 family)
VVDKPKLDQMLSNLRRFLAVLRDLAALSPEAFLADPDKVGNAKYHLVIAIECCIYRFPRDNADSFAVLVEQAVLPAESRDPLRAMARFRNRLVHLYWDVDEAKVHEYLRDGLSDIERFGNAIARNEW